VWTIERNSYWREEVAVEEEEGFLMHTTTTATPEHNTSDCHFPNVSVEHRVYVCVCVL